MATPSTSNSVYLDLLIKHIKEAYEPTTQRLLPLLEYEEITYDLLWALFKAQVFGNSMSYFRAQQTLRAESCRTTRREPSIPSVNKGGFTM